VSAFCWFPPLVLLSLILGEFLVVVVGGGGGVVPFSVSPLITSAQGGAAFST